MRKYFAVLLGWQALPWIVFLYPRDLPSLTCDVLLGFYLVGLLIGLYWFGCVVFGKKRKHSTIALAMLLCCWLVSFTNLGKLGARAHLLVNQSRYETVLEKLSVAKSDAEKKAICGEDCQILSAEPLRVNFHYCHCFLNWTDLVFDSAKDLHTFDREALRKTDMYLFRVETLSGNWVLGYFGD
jgi:hypothetical protein